MYQSVVESYRIQNVKLRSELSKTGIVKILCYTFCITGIIVAEIFDFSALCVEILVKCFFRVVYRELNVTKLNQSHEHFWIAHVWEQCFVVFYKYRSVCFSLIHFLCDRGKELCFSLLAYNINLLCGAGRSIVSQLTGVSNLTVVAYACHKVVVAVTEQNHAIEGGVIVEIFISVNFHGNLSAVALCYGKRAGMSLCSL